MDRSLSSSESNDLNGSRGSLLSKAQARASQMSEGAKEWMRRSGDVVADRAAAMREGAQQVGERTRAYVRDEPMRSVLVAAAVGAGVALAVSWWMSSRRRLHWLDD